MTKNGRVSIVHSPLFHVYLFIPVVSWIRPTVSKIYSEIGAYAMDRLSDIMSWHEVSNQGMYP